MKLEDASKMVATGFFTTLAVGVALAAAGILFLDALAVSLGATPTIMPYAKSYIFYILLGIPWMTASLMLNTLLRFQGSASYAMIGMVSGAVINVVLDPILIYVCKMGVAGAALATMIRVKKAFWFCVKLSVSGLLAITAAAWLFAPDIMAVFRGDDPEVIRIGSLALRLQFLTSPLMGWVIMNNMTFQTIGESLPASALALARQGLFLLPILYLLSHSLGLLGIQVSQPLADAATFALSIPFNIRVMRGMKQ
jgi:Na+-driven multidrug efflux pump